MMCACGSPLGDSPSTYFCSERCQWMWWWERSGQSNPALVKRAADLSAQITEIMERLRTETAASAGPFDVLAC
jgi:hypothetical protein